MSPDGFRNQNTILALESGQTGLLTVLLQDDVSVCWLLGFSFTDWAGSDLTWTEPGLEIDPRTAGLLQWVRSDLT